MKYIHECTAVWINHLGVMCSHHFTRRSMPSLKCLTSWARLTDDTCCHCQEHVYVSVFSSSDNIIVFLTGAPCVCLQVGPSLVNCSRIVMFTVVKKTHVEYVLDKFKFNQALFSVCWGYLCCIETRFQVGLYICKDRIIYQNLMWPLKSYLLYCAWNSYNAHC